MGDLVHFTCRSCRVSWWSEPDRKLGLVDRLLKRPRPVCDRCPGCFGTDVHRSVDLLIAGRRAGGERRVIDLSSVEQVIYLDGVRGKESSDLGLS